VVRADGGPFAGAKVALLKFKESELNAFVLTDASGSYSFSAVQHVSFSGALVSVSKPDYFTETRYIFMAGDQTFDVDLERAVHISLGRAVRTPVGAARCASLGYGGGVGALCRRFAVTASASGTLEAAISSAPSAEFDITVMNPDGTIGVYGSSSSPMRVTLGVTAGATYQIDVVHIWPHTREFELLATVRD
jgi:hypothetical protein